MPWFWREGNVPPPPAALFALRHTQDYTSVWQITARTREPAAQNVPSSPSCSLRTHKHQHAITRHSACRNLHAYCDLPLWLLMFTHIQLAHAHRLCAQCQCVHTNAHLKKHKEAKARALFRQATGVRKWSSTSVHRYTVSCDYAYPRSPPSLQYCHQRINQKTQRTSVQRGKVPCATRPCCRASSMHHSHIAISSWQ